MFFSLDFLLSVSAILPPKFAFGVVSMLYDFLLCIDNYG